MSKNEIEILGVRFNKTTLKEATKTAIDIVKGKKQAYITTPNPEILLEAEKNEKFKKILNGSKLNIADGIGILWASNFIEKTKNTRSKLKRLTIFLTTILSISKQKSPLKNRVTGVDLMEEICKNTNEPIFLLGAQNGTGEKTKHTLKENLKKINIVGTMEKSPKKEDENTIIEEINKKKPKILFVAYGAPKQELWIARNLKKTPSVKLAIGVGGAFDFISKTKKRAPRWMQKAGIEWLFRLIQEPKRIKRIINATIVFPIKVLKKSQNNST